MSNAYSRLVADRYRLIEPLGQGGMGRVWKARDEVLHRDVAIKELVPPPGLTEDERQEMRERSLREARAIARLNHINVVRVFDVLRTDADPWIVMEYVPSRSLHDVLQSDGPVPPMRAAEIGLGMLGALQAAHRSGVMHRDVKPGNVLIGNDGRVVLTDFGLATVPGDPNVTRTGLVLGSPAYIAPERAKDGTAGPQADLWSLGATLYAAVEGQSPYARQSAIATLAALATEPPPAPKNAGPLKGVLAGLLRKDPTQRITAAEAERQLRRIVHRRARGGISLLDGVRRPGPNGPREPRTRVFPAPVSPPASGGTQVPGQRGGSGPAGNPTKSGDTPAEAAASAAGAASATEVVAAPAKQPTSDKSGTPAKPGTSKKADGSAETGGPGPAEQAGKPDEAGGSEQGPAPVERAASKESPTLVDTPSVVNVPDAAAAPGVRSGTKPALPAQVPAPTRSSGTAAAGAPGTAPGSQTAGAPPVSGGPAPSASGPASSASAVGRAPIVAGLKERALDGDRRKWLIAGLAAVLLIALLVIVPLLNAGSDGGSQSGGQPTNPAASGSSAAASVTPSTAPTSAAPSPTPSGPVAPPIPAGWHLQRDPNGFSIPVPDGWTRSVADSGSSVIFSGPDDRELLIQQGDHPKPDAYADWWAQEPSRKNFVQNYQLVGIHRVNYFKTCADWDWLETKSGTRFHVRNRGFVTARNRAYAIRWEIPADEWDQQLPNFNMLTANFKPDRQDWPMGGAG